MTEAADGLQFDWIYRRELFDASTIERMARHFDNLIRAAVAQPQLDVRQLPMLDADERRPLDGVRAYVLNDVLGRQPIGVTMSCTSPRCRRRRPPTTATSAIRSTTPWARKLYRTRRPGTAARRRATLAFVGRRDGDYRTRARRVRTVTIAAPQASARAAAAPETANEEALHDIWSRLLQQETVDVDLNNAAGGNSLLLCG